MTDDVADYAALPLKSEKVALASPSLAAGSTWTDPVTPRLGGAALSLCAALCFWGAPALLLYRYRADELLEALLRPTVQGTDRELLVLFLLLAYLVASGLLLGWTSSRFAGRLGRSRLVLYLTLAPLYLLSLAATMVVAVPLFVGVLIRSFPSLL
jgi:hypothetical protein